MNMKSKPERVIQSECLLSASSKGYRLFRNNVGKAWIGNSSLVRASGTVTVEPGDVVIRKARRFHAGLCEGSSDLIGWRSVTVTPDMVGQKVALFVGFECKTTRGRVTENQDNFVRQVNVSGGIGRIIRCPGDIPG